MRGLALLVAFAACDTAFVEDYRGVVEVSLANEDSIAEIALRLVTVESVGCDRRLAATVTKAAATRRVEIQGVGKENACEAVGPATTTVPLRLGPELPGGYLIEVTHAGATDRYALDLTTPTPTLTASSTTTTRLAATRPGP